MDRRQFLEVLIVAGYGLLRSPRIDAATEAEIDGLWLRLADEPVWFDVVGGAGTLEMSGVTGPRIRADCLGIVVGDNPDVSEIMRIAKGDWRAREVIVQALHVSCNSDATSDNTDDETLDEWLRADSANSVYAAEELREWLQDTDLNEWDYESAYRNSATGQGAALVFWRDGVVDPDEFEVELVDGDSPGSSYYAAEFHGSVDEANSTAIRLGIPIRFREV